MRKRTIHHNSQNDPSDSQDWLDLERLAQVEVTSEDSAHPVEAALMPGTGSGWRAAQGGEQIIRLLVDEPQRLKRIYLVFNEDRQERAQEFVLLWSGDGGQSYREIVRQQFNFSPTGTNHEVEDYNVNLQGVTALELKIVPNTSGGQAVASLTQLRLE